MQRLWPQVDRDCGVYVFRDFGCAFRFTMDLSAAIEAMRHTRHGLMPVTVCGIPQMVHVHNIKIFEFRKPA